MAEKVSTPAETLSEAFLEASHAILHEATHLAEHAGNLPLTETLQGATYVMAAVDVASPMLHALADAYHGNWEAFGDRCAEMATAAASVGSSEISGAVMAFWDTGVAIEHAAGGHAPTVNEEVQSELHALQNDIASSLSGFDSMLTNSPMPETGWPIAEHNATTHGLTVLSEKLQEEVGQIGNRVFHVPGIVIIAHEHPHHVHGHGSGGSSGHSGRGEGEAGCSGFVPAYGNGCHHGIDLTHVHAGEPPFTNVHSVHDAGGAGRTEYFGVVGNVGLGLEALHRDHSPSVPQQVHETIAHPQHEPVIVPDVTSGHHS